MSRYSKKLENGKIVAYGYDHITGYFFQVFDRVGSVEEDYLDIDECSTFTKMSNSRMIELMEMYNSPETHIEQVVRDLPIK